MVDRSLSAADPRLARAVQKRVGASLRHMRGRGNVVSETGARGVVRWGLAG